MIREDLITLDDITHWAPAASCASLRMLRLDKMHPIVSGNKWYKLKDNIVAAKAMGKSALLTFGGGYSNHLVATAAAARAAGLESIGIVRGIYNKPTPTLLSCAALGMSLQSLSKKDYALARNSMSLESEYPQSFIIPEGGANEAGIRGAEDIAALIPGDAHVVCIPVGTGTTIAGLHRALLPRVQLTGFCAAKECDEALRRIHESKPESIERVAMFYSSNAFGKTTEDLIDFMRRFFSATGIPLDVVYTGKMMQRVEALLAEGLFRNKDILCIHTGGLQGNPLGLFV